MKKPDLIPVFIITSRKSFGFRLKEYLETELPISSTVIAEVYLQPRECLQHLILDEVNYIIVDGDPLLVEELQLMFDQPRNLVYDHEIIYTHTLHDPQMDAPVNTIMLEHRDDHEPIGRLIKKLCRKQRQEGKYMHANYIMAGVLMLLAVIVAVLIL